MELPAGPELDRLVAERVMGWKAHVDKHGEWRVVDGDGRRRDVRDVLAVSFDPRTGERREHPWTNATDMLPYSDDITHAWEVVERMTSVGRGVVKIDRCEPTYDKGPWLWSAYFGHEGIDDGPSNRMNYEREGDTAPLAICRAALAAVTVDA